ncbi:COP23 domain-containing protein [Pleurocapsa sp. PCC 7319]|uniref:COP23 domain-containing protein n=1 Tax=Pleurocapsa sp. PCC 7319 TaxID=118161 RepID=UPI00034D7648|nr:COP23 domain-containing protein [Pleurocapsa sp. PCC 7319]
MKSLNNHLESIVSLSRVPTLATGFAGTLGAIAILGTANSVNALPLDGLNLNSMQQLRQAISQSNEPPEVIINGPNSSSSSSTTTTTTTTNRNSDTRFTCELVNGEYTVMYYPESQPNQGYPWAIPSELGGGWTPEKRCAAITSRFESYRQDGLLELTTGVENGYDTICVTTQVDPTDCRLVLTVPPGQDPQLTRDLIFDNLLVADDGRQTQGVYTYGDSQSGEDILNQVGDLLGGGNSGKNNGSRRSPEDIDLRPFLDPADGGTGKQLTRGNSVSPRQSQSSDSEQGTPDLFK